MYGPSAFGIRLIGFLMMSGSSPASAGDAAVVVGRSVRWDRPVRAVRGGRRLLLGGGADGDGHGQTEQEPHPCTAGV